MQEVKISPRDKYVIDIIKDIDSWGKVRVVRSNKYVVIIHQYDFENITTKLREEIVSTRVNIF